MRDTEVYEVHFFSASRGMKKEQNVLLTHGDSVSKVADGLKVIATHGKVIVGEFLSEFTDFLHNLHCYFSSWCPGIANEKSKLYGLQFHPEVDLSEDGKTILKNFLYEVAKCKGTFSMKSREAACIQYIRETVGDHKVLVSLAFCWAELTTVTPVLFPSRCLSAEVWTPQFALPCCTKPWRTIKL